MIKVHKKYREILAKDSRYYIVSGGRGSGKSFSVNALLVLLTYEAGHTILFTRYTLASAYISIIPEFIEKLEMFGFLGDFHITKDEIRNKRSGSKIIFRGIKTSSGDQTANLKSLTGITTWVVDEAEELTDEQKFDTIDLSVRQQGKQNRVILILNPTTKEHFIYGRFFEDRGVQEGVNKTVENTTYIHTTYKRIYLKECFYLQRLTTSQISELNLKHARGGLIIGDSAEPRLLSEIKAKGCNVRPSIKGPGSITYGISLLQDYDIVVSPASTNLIKELNNYRWLEKKSNTPVDSWNHLIDAVRYAVGFQLQNPNRGKYTVS